MQDTKSESLKKGYPKQYFQKFPESRTEYNSSKRNQPGDWAGNTELFPATPSTRAGYAMLAEHASAGQPLAGRVLPLQDHGSGCSGGGSSSTSKVDHIVIMTSTEDVSERGKTGKGVTSASCSNGGGNGGGGVGCGPSLGDCPWARLAGVDGCLSETYCLWFQLLARAYWGELELGLRGSSGCKASWSRLREASRRNCVRSRVRCRWRGGG